MAFRIDFSRSVASELRRVIGERFEYALNCLDRSQGPSVPDAVHEFRKTTKKLRSILRLVASGLPRRERHRWMQVLRLTAVRLAPSRDVEVLEQNLRKAYQALLPDVDLSGRPWSNLSLLEQVPREGAPNIDSAELHAIRAALEETGREVVQSPSLSVEFAVLLNGAVQSYRQGRRLLSKLSDTPSVEALHELRRRVKDHLYQLRLLANLSPKTLRSEAVEFDQLAELLGEHHDLANLKLAIDRSRATYRSIVEQPGLEVWTLRRLSEIEQAAIPLARHIYTEAPKARQRRLSAFHDALIQAEIERAAAERATLTVLASHLR